MFFASDSNNSYPLFYQQSPLSCTNTILDYNNNSTLFHHHLHHYPSSSENPKVKLPLSEPSSLNQENTNIINNNYYPAYSNNVTNNPMPETRRVSTTTTTTGKKDRHTKICTAQGIRDRRVRLSMSIARKFFNLQDMLGFDKASETLGWLLAKSKAAIDELASNNSNNNNNGTTTSIEDLNEEDGDNEFFYDDEKGGLNGERSSSKKRKRQELNRLKEQHLVKEVRREKARERARERTRMKKTIVVADDDHNNNNHHRHQQQQQQYQIERFDYHQQQQQQQIHHQRVHQQDYNSIPSISRGVSVGETIVINKDNNRSRSSFNYNYEMMSSKDDDNQEGGIHYNSDCFNKFASENCNYNGIMQQPASLFPALNIINLSTEIHINARPWDTYSNQILH